MKSITFTILIVLSILAILSYGITTYVSLPEVHLTMSGECVRVINHNNTKYDCENMPTKFINYIVRV